MSLNGNNGFSFLHKLLQNLFNLQYRLTKNQSCSAHADALRKQNLLVFICVHSTDPSIATDISRETVTNVQRYPGGLVEGRYL